MKTDKVLMSNTMQKVVAINRSKLDSGEQFCLDLFLFSYFTGGISLPDMAYLTRDKLKGKQLNIDALDYPKVWALELSPSTMEIIDRYKSKTDETHLLPIFTTYCDTLPKRVKRLRQLEVHMDKTLRKIEKILRCPTLSWHGVRQAFVDFQLRAGGSMLDLYRFAGEVALEVDEYYCRHPKLAEQLPPRTAKHLSVRGISDATELL